MDLNLATFAPVLRSLASAGLPVLEQSLTAILSGATGPFGLLVSPALNLIWPAINGALGLAADTPPDQTAAAIDADPDAARNKLAAVQEDHAYALASDKQTSDAALQADRQSRDYDLASQAQQTAVTQAEVANPSIFVGGWRPAAAWVLVAGLASFVAAPWFVWAVLIVSGKALPPPPTDATVILSMLGALLGLGTMRSYDKQVGTAYAGVGSGTTKMPSPPVAAARKGR